jgi:hypothetical protein
MQYGGNFYHGSVRGRLARRKFKPPGQANEFQVRIKTTGNTQPSISQIGLRFRQASG